LPTQTKIVFKKFPNASKKIKIHHHTARQTQHTMTRKLNIDKAYNDTADRRPAGNTGLAKLAVQCFVGQFLLYLNIGASYEVLWLKSPTSPSPKPLCLTNVERSSTKVVSDNICFEFI
jgi:hypothetical protein